MRACSAAVLAILAAGSAQALDAPLAADTHTSTALPANNFGALPTINVGGGATGLLRFDLGTLPAGTTSAKLVKATLVLYVNRVGSPGAVDLHPVNAAWAEAGVTATNLPPSGGNSLFGVPVAGAGNYMAVDVTAQVKSWITNPASNFGWAIAPALSAPGTVAFFDSKENTATGHVARLDITLADQGPQGVQGVQGPKGDTGPQGLKGDTGAPGLQGLQGVPGSPGQTGATGQQGPRGLQGPQGVQGIQGLQGLQGPTGVVAVGSWSGAGLTTVVSNTAFQFIGPTATLTTTSTQRITASMSQTMTASTTARFRYDICFRPSTGTVLASPSSGYKVIAAPAASARVLLAASISFSPGTGTWVIGPCAMQQGGAIILTAGSGEDWSTGWAFVTN
jgi:hypothetical protein